jgi:integrase
MRRSEILDLRWDNVDFKRRFIRVERSKNNRVRKISMNSAVDQLVSKKEMEKEENKYRVNGHNLVTTEDGEQTFRIVTH